MPLKPLVVPRKYQRIADEIGRLIDAGEFRSGERLPGERVLAAKLGVSRTSLREALSTLELAHRVTIRVGSGVYVRPAPGAKRPRLKTTIGVGEMSPFDVLQARRLIEAETAALAAVRVSPAQLRGIETAFVQLAADMRGARRPSAGDRLFHLRIAEASANSALARLVTILWEQHTKPLAARMETLFVTAARRRDNIAEHQRILDAIRARDPVAARRAMRQHLRNAERQRLALLRDGH